MFNDLFNDLIMTNALAEVLAKLKAIRESEKKETEKKEKENVEEETPKTGGFASYHYREWKDGKPVFERKVEWKDGKKVSDKCTDHEAVIEDKPKDASKVAEASKDTIDPKDIRIKELEKQVEELTKENNNLIRKNADYETKFAKIKNLF